MNYLKRKYMTLMRGVNFQGYLQKASGNPSVLTACISNSPMWLSVFGNSIQDGTPTLDNPVEIQSVGDLVTDETSEYYGKYDIPIVVRGKNLIKYPYATASRTMNGIRYTVNKDGSVSVVGTATAASYFILNSNVDFGNSSIPENSTNGVYATSEGVRYNVSNHTVSINVASGETVDKIVYPQIEYGTTATEYEPYQGSETIHVYLDKPLCKFGDYTDYIDFKNKKVVRNVVQGVLDGSESLSTSGTRYYYYNTKLNIKCLGTSVAGIMSNALPSAAWNWIRNSGTGIATYTDNRIDIRADGIWNSVDEAKEYMKNNPIQYIAPCLVPTEEDISLPALKALKGTNVISVDTSVIPSNMECEYYSTTKQEEE